MDNAPPAVPQAPPPRRPFFSLTGDPAVPALVRVYGAIYQALGALSFVLNLVAGLLSLATGNAGGALLCLVYIVVASVIFSLGKGLAYGERQAVYGLCVLAALALAIAVGVSVMGHIEAGLIIAGIAVIAYAIPIPVAFRRWKLFR